MVSNHFSVHDVIHASAFRFISNVSREKPEAEMTANIETQKERQTDRQTETETERQRETDREREKVDTEFCWCSVLVWMGGVIWHDNEQIYICSFQATDEQRHCYVA